LAGSSHTVALAAAFALLLAGPVNAQTLTVGDPLEDYLRLLQISGRAPGLGSFTVRSSVDGDLRARVRGRRHPWARRLRTNTVVAEGDLRIAVVDPQLRAYANSRFPVGRNDGAVWQGRGLTTALDVGVVAQWSALTVELRPTLLYNQNASQDLAPVQVPGMPAFAYPWRKIDWPQRFGPDPFWTLDPGQSQVRLDLAGLRVGVGTQNIWWGPALRNPIAMSNNAPGFPHGFVGTGKPLGIGIGDLEGRWIWGRLQQSDWFDPSAPSDERFITGIVATYSPSFARGLSLGVTRLFYVLVRDDGVPLGDYFAIFRGIRKRVLATPDNPSGDDEHDQMITLFGRWALAESGFEVYGEWARNDHSWELRDFLLEPEHSQGYTLGLRKAFGLRSNRLLAVTAELTKLEQSTTVRVRPAPSYYAHHIVTQGYTQRGQIVGAGIGPGGNAQFLGFDLYAPWGRAGTWVERQVHDNDAYYAWEEANGGTFCCHDVSFHWGSQALLFTRDFEVGAGMIVTREFNRWFYGLDLWNLNLSLSARWRPR
jgi:hypothetical protein